MLLASLFAPKESNRFLWMLILLQLVSSWTGIVKVISVWPGMLRVIVIFPPSNFMKTLEFESPKPIPWCWTSLSLPKYLSSPYGLKRWRILSELIPSPLSITFVSSSNYRFVWLMIWLLSIFLNFNAISILPFWQLYFTAFWKTLNNTIW